MFHFRTWDIDPDQPRVEGPGRKELFRHYFGLKRMESRLRRLLSDFRWDRVDGVFPKVCTPKDGRPPGQPAPSRLHAPQLDRGDL
jgi:hypothetical protein